MNLFGKSKSKASAETLDSSDFNRVQVFSKPPVLNSLLEGLKDETVEAEVSRQKLKAASLVSGRGHSTLFSYSIYKFKSGPRPVVVLKFPRSTMGGNFVPADMPLEAGETVEFSYSMSLPQVDGNLFFVGRGVYLQTAIFLSNPKNPAKPWVASREMTEKKLGKGALRQGEEVLQVRVDQITVYPNGPEFYTGAQVEPYVFSPKLYVIPGGGVWSKRGNSGYFEGVQEDIAKYLDNVLDLKTITGMNILEFGVDQISMALNESLLRGVKHDSVRPSVLKKVNQHLQEVNSGVGFLLYFQINDDVKELLMRSYAQKIGKEVEVFLPLTLAQLTPMDGVRERATFLLFPRDLVVETNPLRRRSNTLGLKFVPPFTLYPNPEDQNTYRKLMVAIGQRMRDDSRPEDDRNKLSSVIQQVQQRREQTRPKYVDENLKKAFMERRDLRRKKDAQS